MDLDNIWDEPILQDSPKRPKSIVNEDDSEEILPQPTKRPRQALFLADSDDDDVEVPPSRVVQRAPPAQDIDIDALFADIDNEEEVGAFQPLAPRLSDAELARQAEERAKRDAPLPFTPHQIIPSSSPQRDTGNPNRSNSKSGTMDDPDKQEKKERRKLAKLDENRLLSKSGFPELIRMTKDFRMKGKGHEATDLNRLLQTYQYWTHQLYPKTQFRDTVERVEKLCHSRRMNVALSVWRDEAHGRPSKQTNTSEGEDSEDEDGQSKNQNTSPSRASSPPLSAPPSEGDMLERPSPQSFEAPPNSGRDEDEQEDFWRSLDEFNNDTSSESLPVPTTAPSSTMDEDEEMWDLIDEVERAEQAAKQSASSNAAAPSTEPPGNHNLEEDEWEDMYL
ncbi:Swi1-interacting protein swi3 [Psilocybe cubensis]|uniref:Swi1-interacting protein swi3 n=2 Tax=Psilocybe cubensis TaxID=181762 RepID=A0ACB8H8T9_PSICU|nr:Swi1-interacting protein swi3 [Psilocybe cubensis]KAH9484213.1 Swi1-interacting protein swi3 [Psilocybe cubensis]